MPNLDFAENRKDLVVNRIDFENPGIRANYKRFDECEV